MANTIDYINALKRDKANLANNIVDKGVLASEGETFTSLVDKVAAIQTGGTGGGSGDEELVNSYMSLIDNTLGANVTKLPDGITSIGDYGFYGRTNLAITELPKTLTYIGRSAFNSCTNLQLTEIWGTLRSSSNSYVEIPQLCFYNCTYLKTIKVLNINNPKNLSLRLDNNCFKSCSRLETVDLPANTYQILDYVFQSCSALKTLICRAVTPPAIYSTAFSGVTFDVIYVPDNSLSAYKSASNWSKYASVMKPLSELEV